MLRSLVVDLPCRFPITHRICSWESEWDTFWCIVLFANLVRDNSFVPRKASHSSTPETWIAVSSICLHWSSPIISILLHVYYENGQGSPHDRCGRFARVDLSHSWVFPTLPSDRYYILRHKNSRIPE